VAEQLLMKTTILLLVSDPLYVPFSRDIGAGRIPRSGLPATWGRRRPVDGVHA